MAAIGLTKPEQNIGLVATLLDCEVIAVKRLVPMVRVCFLIQNRHRVAFALRSPIEEGFIHFVIPLRICFDIVSYMRL